jgi:hypothetical protein
MKTEMQLKIIPDATGVPSLHLTPDGVTIGESRTEGQYDDVVKYIAPRIPWQGLQEFIDMLEKAKEYQVQMEPPKQEEEPVRKYNKRAKY